MATDPRILIGAFDDLRRTVQAWTVKVSALEMKLDYVSIETANSVDKISERVAAVEDLARAAYKAAERANELATSAQVRAAGATETAGTALNDSQSVIANARSAREVWASSTDKALGMLQTAESNYAAAERELSIAYSNLRNAESELSSARSAYNACRSSYTVDSKGNRQYRSCVYEAGRVDSAAAEVQRCASHVSFAQSNVDAAKAKLEMCRNVLEQCRSGLSKASEIASGVEANEMIARSGLSSANHAQAESVDARILANDSMAIADQLLADVENAQSLTAAMRSQMITVPNSANVARETAENQRTLDAAAKAMLAELEEKLMRFDAVQGMLLQ